MADGVATTTARSDSIPWTVDYGQQDDIQFVARLQGSFVDSDLRSTMKQQTVNRRHQAWTTQKRIKRAIPDLEDVEWRSTLAIIHHKRPVHTFFSSRKDTFSRSHHVKKLHGMLPTLNVMQSRHPYLYQDCVCRVCEEELEDNAHVWDCSATMDTQQEIWAEALDKVDAWGSTATRSADKLRQDNFDKDVARGRPGASRPPRLHWQCPSTPSLWRSLASIIDISARRPHSIPAHPLWYQRLLDLGLSAIYTEA